VIRSARISLTAWTLTEREDDLEYLMAFVDQTAIFGGALLLHVAGRHM
jgi:hypothetical protein